MVPSVDTTNLDVHSRFSMATEPKQHESTVGTETVTPEVTERKPYEPPRIERRIPVSSNTLQPTSGSQAVFPEE